MSTTSLISVFRELFVAPLNAAASTEEDYRQIWANWLEQQHKLLTGDDGQLKPGVEMDKILDLAPVINLDGVIEVGITMRIASVKEYKTSGEVGMSLGPIYGSGGFGFVNRSSQESVFQASTRFAMSNFDRNLKKYLEDRNIQLTDAKDLTEAVAILRKPLSVSSEQE
jgi:hypothetical protein